LLFHGSPSKINASEDTVAFHFAKKFNKAYLATKIFLAILNFGTVFRKYGQNLSQKLNDSI